MIAVIDTETTGDGPEDQVIELAVVETTPEGEIETCRSVLFKPTVPIHPAARGVHHIQDWELDGELTAAEWLAGGAKSEMIVALGSASHVAAHNMEFDERLVRQTGLHFGDDSSTPTICTYRCAMHLWPDAPSHKNQALRYWLGLVIPELMTFVGLGVQAHRAAYDAIVTAAILGRMLEVCTPERLAELTAAPVLLSTVRFGEHRGKRWSEVPHGYLKWIERQGAKSEDNPRGFDRDTRHTTLHHLGRV